MHTPLTRDNVTAASRIMLPTYVAFFAAQGLNYIVADGTAAATPSLAYVDRLMDLNAWGVVFLGCSTLMLAALLTRRRVLYRFALRVCAISMGAWATFIAAASVTGNATPLACTWAAVVSVACVASDRSLGTGER